MSKIETIGKKCTCEIVTSWYECEKCKQPCDVQVPIQNYTKEPEPTQKLGWEEEFDGMELGDGLCPLCAGLASIGSDTSENCQDCKTPTTREELNAFIRKVEKEAYEKGFRECKAWRSTTMFTKEEIEACEHEARANIAQECYLQCLAVECGEGECAEAIRTKFPDLVTTYEI